MRLASNEPSGHAPIGEVDVAVVGGGLSGLATAARLQTSGRSTVVLEAHSFPGGCSGYFRRKGFAFDVGATTLVDFEPGGVGGEFLDSIGMSHPPGDLLPGYQAWLPDRIVTLHRDPNRWHPERLRSLGDSQAHRDFWALLDKLADAFWDASRKGISLPLRSPGHALAAARILPPQHWPLGRHLFSTMGDALRRHGLRDDKALVGLLSMLIEDTVHATVDDAPLINAALGITIRGAGLTRAHGGMSGFMQALTAHYEATGGRFARNCEVQAIRGGKGNFGLETTKGTFRADQVVAAIPISITARIAPEAVTKRLDRFIKRDADRMGGALVMFLGVPEAEVSDHEWTHHQVLVDYDQPLGLGNNMFISVSAAGDLASAPAGHRAVMISTHCDLDMWEQLERSQYQSLKSSISDRMAQIARRVYPRLATNPVVFEMATPRTFERFARRPNGAVGGVRQTLRNTNLFAVPHEIGVDGFHLVGDSTWPGLGTVACTLGSRIVAGNVLKSPATATRTAKAGVPA
ncbi:MAG: FAD-dependent oxidoreductase [Acidimicrobiales bacterium]|nr:FAD-dependent oxidoreductase [Acidimicrobiales bacterium]